MYALKRGEIPSISGLIAFVAAAQHRSFTRAASALNLSQAAISRQIQELESRLGIRLFERSRNRIVLTDPGTIYLSDVKKALEHLVEAGQKVAALANGTTLNLVVLPTFGVHWLVPRLSDFQTKNPRILINLTTRQEPVDFAAEPFDAAVFHERCNWPGTIAHHLLDEEVFAVCSPKLTANCAINSPAQVASLPLLHPMSRPGRWAEWMTCAGLAPHGPLHGHTYQSYAMLALAATAGLGVALLPRYLIEKEVVARRLEIVAPEIHLKTSYYLILPEARASSTAVQTFANWLMEEAREWTNGNHLAMELCRPTLRKRAMVSD
jgi:LysR family transcriptional regulator, glycine cleavage system transcriptional activator